MTAIHEETKMLITQGFKEQERAFDEEHSYNSKNHKKLEDDIERMYSLAKEGKRKSDKMEEDAEEEEEE
eukprot:15461838-Heterocapsa_arctica.AAC.1